MGFYANLLIVRKQKGRQAEEGHTVWRIESVISLDRVTGVEKITEAHFRHLKFEGRERAAICIIATILDRLTRKARVPQKSAFAPVFITEELKRVESLPGKTLKRRYPKVREWVMPVEKTLWWDKKTEVLRVPGDETLALHNKRVSLKERVFSRHIIGPYKIVEDTPLAWESCGEVALWIHEMQKSAGDAWEKIVWEKLIEDDDARSYAIAWRTYLEEMGKTGARVIFLFDHLDIPSFL